VAAGAAAASAVGDVALKVEDLEHAGALVLPGDRRLEGPRREARNIRGTGQVGQALGRGGQRGIGVELAKPDLASRSVVVVAPGRQDAPARRRVGQGRESAVRGAYRVADDARPVQPAVGGADETDIVIARSDTFLPGDVQR